MSSSTQELKQSQETKHLGFLTLLKQSLTIPFRNIHFTLFILVTSIPLLALMIFFETILEEKLHESLKLVQAFVSSKEYWYVPYYHIYEGLETLSKVFYEKIVLLALIYLIPLPMLEFLVAYVTIYLASKVCKDDARWSSNVSKKQRLKNVKGFFVTSFLVMFVSTTLFLGFIWWFIALYSSNLISVYAIFVIVLYLGGLAVAMPKYLEANAVWNLSLVMSVLGDIHGIDAFAVSFRCRKGKEMVGSNLMLVFFVLGLGLRIPCMFFDDGMVGIIGRTTLLWLVTLMKWVVCVVYYYECMGTALEKRMADHDGGSCGGADEESSVQQSKSITSLV